MDSLYSAIERLASDVRAYDSAIMQDLSPKIYDYVIDGETHQLVVYYREELSQRNYTRRYTYDVLSTIDTWGKLRKAIIDCLRFEGIDSGTYHHRYKMNPTFENYLQPYYTYEVAHIEGLEDGTVYRFTEIYPYDD